MTAARLSRRERTSPAMNNPMLSRMTNDATLRRTAMAAAGVAAALAVMGGSLALALGVLGDEHPLPTRPPSAVVGGAGGADGGSAPSGGAPRGAAPPGPGGQPFADGRSWTDPDSRRRHPRER